jgi:putative transposase
MARKLRVEYAGAIYHVMNRGDRRERIFMDDADRKRFVETLGEVCAKTGWQVRAYVLMPNHFHWVVETPQPNLVAGMKHRWPKQRPFVHCRLQLEMDFLHQTNKP